MSEIETSSSPRTATASPGSTRSATVSSSQRGVAIEPTEGTPSRPTSPPTSQPVNGAAPIAAPNLTRRGRVRKWDRPPAPHDWRWYVGNLGKTLITLGLLMFGFVAYQLWGTGIETARAQNKLESQFEELLAAAPPVEFDETFVITDSDPEVRDTSQPVATDSSGADAADETEDDVAATIDEPIEIADVPPAVPVEDQNIPLVEDGDALARVEIPSIGVNDIVVAGVETGDLKKGPGHFPDTPLPGQLGNAAIAGHRTTYGQPFHNVDKLQVGDDIRVTTLNGVYTYKVTGQQIVSPADYQVISTSDPTRANLTLVSCHPKWTAQQRIIIFSELATTESAPVGEPVLNYGRPDEPVAEAASTLPDEGVSGDVDESGPVPDDAVPPAQDLGNDGGVSGNLATTSDSDLDQLGTAETNEGIADAFSEGWFSDPSANPHVGFWGLVLAAIAIGAYLLSRRFRRDWVGGLVGLLPFVVVLYFFFQNVNRLLPPNL